MEDRKIKNIVYEASGIIYNEKTMDVRDFRLNFVFDNFYKTIEFNPYSVLEVELLDENEIIIQLDLMVVCINYE